jgi:geranylgeranyl diphosphate synthase type I
MRDDVMGAFGDETLTGKSVGGDLREGKPTPLLARAVRRANPEQLAVLDDVGAPGLDGHGVTRIQQVIVETGALAELEDHITALTERAISAIEEAPITEAAKTELVALAEYVSWRTV